MANIRIKEVGIEGHIEHKVLKRSFETVEAAQKFAAGKMVFDIFGRRGRFVVEYEKITRVLYDKDGFPEKRVDI